MTSNPLNQTMGPAGSTCAECVWYFVGGRGRAVDRCRRHGADRIDPQWPGCEAYTADLDCTDCAACCREAYHAVELRPRDPFVRAHPDRVETVDGRLNLPRPGGRCVCLEGVPGKYSCVTYDERPQSCREFEVGGANCVDARVRVGLTP